MSSYLEPPGITAIVLTVHGKKLEKSTKKSNRMLITHHREVVALEVALSGLEKLYASQVRPAEPLAGCQGKGVLAAIQTKVNMDAPLLSL